MNKHTLQVCLSNNLMDLYQNDIKNHLVVFIDVLRNTSTMTAALFYGINKVKPVAKVEEAAAYLGKPGYLVAGERHGIKIPEFDAGNSPLFFKDRNNANQTLVITSTNGTQSVHLSKNAKVLCCGGFVNQSKLVQFILQQNLPTLLLASGWRGNVNLEDTLFAGALVHSLKNHFDILGDPALLAEQIYTQHKSNLLQVVTKASHFTRIANGSQKGDIAFCFLKDVTPVVPIYDGEFLSC